MKKYDVITIGGATEDITFYTDEGLLVANRKDVLRQKLLAFEYGTKIKINNSRYTFGGGAANTAVSLARLGLCTASLVSVGMDDRGKRIIKNLKKQKVDTSFVQRSKDSETGFSFIIVGQGNEHVVFSNRAANEDLRVESYQLNFLENTNWLYLASLSGDWKGVLKNIFSIKDVKIVWNPGHAQLMSGIASLGKYLKKTEVLILNKDEAIELVVSHRKYKKKTAKFLNNIENLIKILKSFGPSIVVVTNGRYGASAFDGKKIYRQTIIKEKNKKDTTGVGDAFGSSFVAGLEIYNGNIKKAMHLGARNSASVITKQGAQNGLMVKRDI